MKTEFSLAGIVVVVATAYALAHIAASLVAMCVPLP